VILPFRKRPVLAPAPRPELEEAKELMAPTA
jgi:hypothetical protein